MNKIKSLITSYRKPLTVVLTIFVFLVVASTVGHHIFYNWLHEDGPLAPYMMKIHHFEQKIFSDSKHMENMEHDVH
jgi:hypothetical protein